MSPDFIEHKPDVPEGTGTAAASFLEQLIANVPQPKWTILRTIAEGDLVFLHARFSPAAGAPEYAIADVFNLRGCKIIEHWDVVAPPPKEQRNPNPRFLSDDVRSWSQGDRLVFAVKGWKAAACSGGKLQPRQR